MSLKDSVGRYYPHTTLEERFWDQVDKGSNDECWIWSGSIHSNGYPAIYKNKKVVLANRLSLKIHYGEFDNELDVCHKCDNPKCVNPNHLFLGTQQDNVADMNSKGRGYKLTPMLGSKNPSSKLTEDQVKQIHIMLSNGYTQKEIAKMFGVIRQTISDIKRGRRWGWLNAI